ncbi:hypothetical protein MWN34_03210 [Ancylobacter sp. 6x-1]|uniref:Protein ImuA n=1 Tax=Ancylobacter crimeensis TaxID=2579147 RepID=A0ABT0D7I9_9HYPH|nr:hypothetical protein [Ancylobacter crimeensis]MCK0195913.1 hypothetical protein [Ancylobacter crimeensis]
MRPTPDITALRKTLASHEAPRLSVAGRRFSFGVEGLDSALGGGLPAGALHEIIGAAGADLPEGEAFTALLAARAAQGRPILWIRQDLMANEGGMPDARGLAALGLDPGAFLLVRARNGEQALRAASDGAACTALGAVLIEIWGEPRRLDLTATRRLALRAAESGVTLLMLRLAARVLPSASHSRWRVAPLLSVPLEARAPGPPAFALTLLRQRAGPSGVAGEAPGQNWNLTWQLEWDRDQQRFRTPDSRRKPRFLDGPALSRPVAALPAGRPAGAGRADRKAG